MKQRVVGYARVSTEKQDLERQRILIRNFCEVHGYHLSAIIEEKISGAKEDRDSLKQLESIDRQTADLVVVSELSRLSREEDVLPVLNLLNQLLKKGIGIHFIDEPEKTYKGGSKLGMFEILKLVIKAGAAAEERKKICTRMSTGRDTKLSINPYMYVGGTPPYGFKVVPNPEYCGQKNNVPAKSIIVIDEDTIENVKLIYRMVLDSVTLRDAAKRMNSIGAKTQLNKPFCETSIAKIVRNPIYNGRRRYKEMDLQIEKIIPDSDWNRAQVCISQNRLFKDTATRNFNPLKGIVFCPCGYALMIHQMHGGYYVLQCCKKNDMAYRKKCRNSGIRTDVLFPIVWKCVCSTLPRTDYQDQTLEATKSIEQEINYLQKTRDEKQGQIAEYQKELERITNNILTDLPETMRDRLVKRYEGIEATIEDLKEQISAANTDIIKLNEQVDRMTETKAKELLENMRDEDKAVVYKRVLSRVVYYSVDYLYGFIVIDYQNGMRNVVAVRKRPNSANLLLPTAFSFNKESRTVSVVTGEIAPHFSFGEKEYGIRDLFNLDGWKEWMI